MPHTWEYIIWGLRVVICTFMVQKWPNFICWKIVENKSDFSRHTLLDLRWLNSHPGVLLDVYFHNLDAKRYFFTDMSARNGRFQKGSKTTKMTKSPQKSQKFDNLSVLAKIIGPALRFDQFWAQSDQKKSIFSTFEKIWDFPIVIWPNPKSGPFGQILAPKIWSWSIFIS